MRIALFNDLLVKHEDDIISQTDCLPRNMHDKDEGTILLTFFFSLLKIVHFIAGSAV